MKSKILLKVIICIQFMFCQNAVADEALLARQEQEIIETLEREEQDKKTKQG